MTRQPIHALTRTNKGLARVLEIPVKVMPPVVDPAVPPVASRDCAGIWDTGATGTMITQQIADDLGLKPSGIAKVHTANGPRDCPTYLLTLVLNDAVAIGVTATVGDLMGCEVLLGMDVISLGDFSVTNYGGSTMVSFRIPSCGSVDYVKQAKLADQAKPKKKRPHKRH